MSGTLAGAGNDYDSWGGEVVYSLVPPVPGERHGDRVEAHPHDHHSTCGTASLPLVFQATPSAPIYIHVDSEAFSDAGPFTLTVQRENPNSNETCAADDRRFEAVQRPGHAAPVGRFRVPPQRAILIPARALEPTRGKPMTETEELRAALSAGVRRPRLPMFVMAAISLGFVVTSLVVPTDLGGRIVGLVVAALLGAMAVAFYRQAARHVRLSEAFLANPQILVWLTFTPSDPHDDGLDVERLDLYFDTGEHLQLALPTVQGKEVYRHLCTLCPDVATGTGAELFALWKADPKSLPPRVKELQK